MPRAHARGEIAAGQVLHREIMQLRRRDADVVDRDDVRMRERRQHARFLQEAFGERGVGGQRRRHHLERDFAIERGLHRQMHAGHAAAADLTLDV